MLNSAETRFSRIVGSHLETLFRTAYRLTGKRADAEDLVQDVCLRAYPRLSELEKLEKPLAWLLKVQYRLFVDETRRRERSKTQRLDAELERSPYMTSKDPGPEECAQSAAASELLWRAWGRLEKTQRALLALRAEGRSLAEINQITGLPATAIKARLHRARVRLTKLLNESAEPKPISTGEHA